MKHFMKMREISEQMSTLSGEYHITIERKDTTIILNYKGLIKRFEFDLDDEIVINCWGMGFPTVYKKTAPLNMDKILMHLFRTTRIYNRIDTALGYAKSEKEFLQKQYDDKASAISMDKEETDVYTLFKVNNLFNNRMTCTALYLDINRTVGDFIEAVESNRGRQELFGRLREFSELSMREYMNRFKSKTLLDQKIS